MSFRVEGPEDKKRTILKHTIFCVNKGCEIPLITSDQPIPEVLVNELVGLECSECREPTEFENMIRGHVNNNRDLFYKIFKEAFYDKKQH